MTDSTPLPVRPRQNTRNETLGARSLVISISVEVGFSIVETTFQSLPHPQSGTLQ